VDGFLPHGLLQYVVLSPEGPVPLFADGPDETLYIISMLTILRDTGSIILAGIGAKPSLVSLLAGVLNIFFALGCFPLIFTIERVGRRSVLMYGAMAMSVLIGIFTVLVAIPPTPAIQWASIGIIFIFLFVFGYAWQGCVWLYCSEIAPLEYRHIGGAFCATGEWLMTFTS
jgi:MFS family permease